MNTKTMVIIGILILVLLSAAGYLASTMLTDDNTNDRSNVSTSKYPNPEKLSEPASSNNSPSKPSDTKNMADTAPELNKTVVGKDVKDTDVKKLEDEFKSLDKSDVTDKDLTID